MNNEKKSYDFGEVEVLNFEELTISYLGSSTMHSVYAFIPACDSDGAGGYFQDPCMSMN